MTGRKRPDTPFYLKRAALDEMTCALNAPMSVTQEELRAVQAFEPKATELKPMGVTHLTEQHGSIVADHPQQNLGRIYSTQLARGNKAGQAFWAVQHRAVRAGLDILLKPEICESVAGDVRGMMPEKFLLSFDYDYLEKEMSYSVFFKGTTENITAFRLYADLCVQSPALAILGYMSRLYLDQLSHAFGRIADHWQGTACPHLMTVFGRTRNDLCKALKFPQTRSLFVFSPVIAIGFQEKVTGTADDLLQCTPGMMRWVITKSSKNGLFKDEFDRMVKSKAFFIDCPAENFMRALAIGQANDGSAFGPGVPGLAQWLHTQRDEQWFIQGCRELKESLKEKAAFYRTIQSDDNLALEVAMHKLEFTFGRYRGLKSAEKRAPGPG